MAHSLQPPSAGHPATAASGHPAGSGLQALLTADSAARKPGKPEWEEDLFWFQLSREKLVNTRPGSITYLWVAASSLPPTLGLGGLDTLDLDSFL